MIDADKIILLCGALRRLKNLSRVSAMRVALDAGFVLSEVERLIDAALMVERERRGVAA